jgi:hypothetical protein
MGRETTTPEWEFAGSVYLPKWHCLVYRDEKLGVQKEVHTRRYGATPRGKPKVSYYLTDVEGRFRTEKQLMRAWVRKSKKGHPSTRIRIIARECLLFLVLIAAGFFYVEIVHFHQFRGLDGLHDLFDEFRRSLNHVSRFYLQQWWLSLLAPYVGVQAGRAAYFSIRRLTQKRKRVV